MVNFGSPGVYGFVSEANYIAIHIFPPYWSDDQCVTSHGANGTSPLCTVVSSASYHMRRRITAFFKKINGALHG